MGLLQQMTGQGPMRLLRVPRTSTGTAEPRHDLHQVQQSLTLGGRFAHGVGDAGDTAVLGELLAEGSVLLIGTTVSVLRSYFPNPGFT